jgi:hypothetical protein
VDIDLLLSRAVEEGLARLRHSPEPICPYLMIYDDSHPDPRMRSLEVRRFVGDDLQASVEQARASVVPRPGRAMYAIGWDGYATVEGRRWDALLVEIGHRDRPEARVMAQRYELTAVGRFRRSHQNVPVGELLLAQTHTSRLWTEPDA